VILVEWWVRNPRYLASKHDEDMMTERSNLPSFADTHNWREEIKPYRISDWNFRPPNMVSFASRKEVEPVSAAIPIRLAELIWHDPELKIAMRARKKWLDIVTAEPMMNPDHPRWNENPVQAYDLLNQFAAWYILRVGEPSVFNEWYGCAEAILCRMLNEEFDSFCDQEILSLVTSDPWGQFFRDDKDD
jgi:hypothetical protein